MAKSKFLQDFKAFAVKGNAVDMAVGVIIGGAFGKIVSSIVNDLIMPPIGWLLGGMDFKDLSLTIGKKLSEDGVTMEKVTLNYGNFLQNVTDFVIIAFCVFLLVRFITKLTARKAAEPEPPAAEPAPSREEVLLAEIRDLLRKQG